MNNRRFITLFFLASVLTIFAQNKPEQWDLISCINYAKENNIQIQKSKISLEQNSENTKLAQSQFLPSLSASVGQNYTNRPFLQENSLYDKNTYNGNYGVNASMTLFSGGKLMKNLQQQKIYEEMSQYAVLEAEKNIEISILQIYMQILYAQEAVNVYKEVIEASQYQRDRGEALLSAGMISRVDLAQLEAQLSSDKYQLIGAQNTLQYAKLQLKQLLELTINDDINIVIPEINEENILKPLPDLYNVYFTSLEVMPQMQSSRLNVDAAELEIAKARAGYFPRLSLSASAGSSNISGSGLTFGEQLKYNFNDGVGLSLNIPIFSNRENKTAVQKAKLSEQTAKLDYQDTQKSLLQEVELAHQDAVSSQSQYVAATENVKALEISYGMIQQQYELGMKNTLELLTEKNNLLTAQQSQLQAKYTSIMNSQILNLYQDLPIEIK